jgi:ribose transport system ATP-binding protein
MKLEMKGINKSFGPVKVLFDVDFTLDKNEIQALIGENGAGKSTLMKILTGIYSMDSGEIKINGNQVSINSIQDSQKYKIAIVNQELNVFKDMTVLENLFVGKEISNNGFINNKEQTKLASAIFKRLGIKLNLETKVKELSIGMQQMLEIAKSLVNDAEVIIMDEPTSALTEKEIEILFGVIKKLKKDGKSIVYISHRLKEIYQLCDSITILRDGKFIKKSKVNQITFDEVVKNMVGYELGQLIPEKPKVKIGKQLLKVENLSIEGKFNDVNFELNEGEIIGFAGLMGSGRTEIMNAIFGVDKYEAGQIKINGKNVEIFSVAKAKKLGIGYVTENRKDEGLFLDFSILLNIIINNFKILSKKLVIDKKASELIANKMTSKMKLKFRDLDQSAYELSGGNQQKVVLSKWLASNPRILILDEPTRGIDVNAKKQIYEMIFELKKTNIGIILVSSELIELLGMSDRIYVMREGKMMKQVVNNNITDETIMKYMMGG